MYHLIHVCYSLYKVLSHIRYGFFYDTVTSTIVNKLLSSLHVQ